MDVQVYKRFFKGKGKNYALCGIYGKQQGDIYDIRGESRACRLRLPLYWAHT